MTAPDIPGRLRALRKRGGKFVVVDPRRTKTADEADEHLPIRPGTDALFLFALVHVLFADDLVDLGTVAPTTSTGLDEVRELAAEFTPGARRARVRHRRRRRSAASRTSSPAAPTAAVYGRIGTCTQEFGTLASWLVDVLNVCTGNLDRPGGAMFTLPATGGGEHRRDRRQGSRRAVRPAHARGCASCRSSSASCPVVCLAEEIETPGEGQIRALITIAGNPARLDTRTRRGSSAALASLDFMVSIDIYVNETTRHADVILPPEAELARGHYDLALYSLAIRNVANYSPPLVDLEPRRDARVAHDAAARRRAPGPRPRRRRRRARRLRRRRASCRRRSSRPGSNVEGRDADELLKALAARRGPERVLDFMLRTGPYGDGFGADPDGLSLDVLEANPHGIDLGPLQPRLPDVLRTPTGMIELAPEPCVADVPRLRAALDRRRADDGRAACSSAGATSARTTRGCTISTCS